MDQFPNPKKEARLAGLFYLLHIITSIYGVIYVSSTISMIGDPAAIVYGLRENELLFRSGIFNRLVSSIPWILLALALYRLLKPVNSFQARLMVAWMALPIPLGFMAEVFNISSLMIAKGEMLKSMSIPERQDFAVFFLNTYSMITSVSEMFWGLWLLPLGILVHQSGFFPRVLGCLLFLGGAGYIIECIIFLLFPVYKSSVSPYTMLFGAAVEIAMMLWLLIKGTKDNALAAKMMRL